MNRNIHSLVTIFLSPLLFFLLLSCAGPGPYPVDPEITVHTPRENTFYVPNTDEPLVVLISFPETMAAGSPIFDIELLNDEGSVVFRRGGPPTSGPLVTIGTQPGQKQTLSPPEMTTPGWYTVKVYGETVWGESEPFRLSHIGPIMDDHAVTVNFPAETAFHPGGTIHLSWHAWGDDCEPASGYTIWLYHNGSHGASHAHWILASDVSGSEGDFTLPADVPTGGLSFLRVYNGPRCEGTSAPIPIAP